MKIIQVALLFISTYSNAQEIEGKNIYFGSEVKNKSIDSVVITCHNHYTDLSFLHANVRFNADGLISKVYSGIGSNVQTYEYESEKLIKSMRVVSPSESIPYHEIQQKYDSLGRLTFKMERMHEQIDSTTYNYSENKIDHLRFGEICQFDTIIKKYVDSPCLILTVKRAADDNEWRETEQYLDADERVIMELIYYCDTNQRKLIATTSRFFNNGHIIVERVMSLYGDEFFNRSDYYEYYESGLPKQINEYSDVYNNITYTFEYFVKNKKLTLGK